MRSFEGRTTIAPEETALPRRRLLLRRRLSRRRTRTPALREDFVKLGDLADNVRIKRGGPFMHLKAYEINSTLLRTGSAKFSTCGENAQEMT